MVNTKILRTKCPNMERTASIATFDRVPCDTTSASTHTSNAHCNTSINHPANFSFFFAVTAFASSTYTSFDIISGAINFKNDVAFSMING